MQVLEVLTAHAGTSSNTDFDFGITGGDLDNFVDGFDFDGASVGDFAASAEGGPVMVGATDTIDLEIQAMTGTTYRRLIKNVRYPCRLYKSKCYRFRSK